VQQRPVDAAYFAEGLAEWNGQLIQLTWQSQIAFVHDLATFSLRRTFRYTGEGWGLTRDQNSFILSDGSSQLRFMHPETFREIRRVAVTDGGRPVEKLNELEYIRGEVHANVWQTNRIARISPRTGRVIRWLDLSGLMGGGFRLDDVDAVLNGIAYDAAGNRLFVTGKLWPRLFEIEIVPRR
jgi:glutamine cyclotransferase